MYDSCEAHNRALKALGVSEESYSSIVVPVIVEKLPESFRLTITRGTDFLQWSMEEMLDAFVRELELREAHNAVGTTAIVNMERDQQRQRKNPYTAAALSHRSFVTSKAASLVNPKGLRRELLGINTFGQKCTRYEQRDVVELKLKPLHGDKVITVEAYVVPEISSIQNAHIELARREYQHLKGT